MSPNTGRRPATLLFNPFFYVAGAKALALGLAAILLAGLIGAWSKTHFDGVLDTHVGARAPLWFFLSEGIADWMCLAAVLLIAGIMISKSSFRIIDVLGTQALARWPTVLLSLITFPPAFSRFGGYLMRQLSKPESRWVFSTSDAAVFFAVLIATVLLTSWLVVLMYQAFAVACNVRGGKAIGTFIAALIFAEVLSKIALYLLSLILLSTPGAITPAAGTSPVGIEHDGAQVVDLMARGDFAAATASFDATMKRVLPEERLRVVWENLQEQAGPLKSRLYCRVERQQGHDAVFVACQFERATLEAKVVFDAKRQIVGLFFVPSQAGAAP